MSPADQVLFEREVVERSQNGELPMMIVPYYNTNRSTNLPSQDIESVVVHGNSDSD